MGNNIFIFFLRTAEQNLTMEVDDPRRISVHLAPIPQPPTRDDIVASQKSRFEDQDKTIDYIVA
jgi:hypothetical protein